MFRLEKESSSVKLSLGTISKNSQESQDQREEIDMSLDVTKGLKHQLPLVRTFWHICQKVNLKASRKL